MKGAPRHTGALQARALVSDDRVDRPDGAVALVGTSVVRLSPVAAALVDACPDWATPADLAVTLVTRFGQPDGDAEEVVRSMLVDLAAEGLVELR